MQPFLLASVVSQHAKILADGIAQGQFETDQMRALIAVEEQWHRLAQLPSNGSQSCVESLSNLIVEHVKRKTVLPRDFGPIGAACAQSHHPNGAPLIHQHSLVPQTNRHFQAYARMLVELAQQDPHTQAWQEYLGHTLNAAAALGTHLDWVVAIQNETPRYRRGQRGPQIK